MELNKDVLDTVNFLPDQLWQAWDESRKVALPDHYRNFKRVLVCGMGGSALGGRVVKSYATQRATASIDVLTDYNLPSYVDGETLTIVASYSGNTEETVSVLKQSLHKSVPVYVMATGGELLKIANENSLPVYKIDPQYNPSNQPRLATGYLIGAIFGVLTNCGILNESDQTIGEVVDWLKTQKAQLSQKGKELADAIYGKAPILVASEHLVGSAHIFKNQLNESAKTFSALFDIPELNHHLMEGLKNPSDVTSGLTFIFFRSSLYTERVQKRYPITVEVVGKNNIVTHEIAMEGQSKLEQVFEQIQLGSYAQIFLGAAYKEDPVAIPWVDYFKEKLSAFE